MLNYQQYQDAEVIISQEPEAERRAGREIHIEGGRREEEGKKGVR